MGFSTSYQIQRSPVGIVARNLLIEMHLEFHISTACDEEIQSSVRHVDVSPQHIEHLKIMLNIIPYSDVLSWMMSVGGPDSKIYIHVDKHLMQFKSDAFESNIFYPFLDYELHGELVLPDLSLHGSEMTAMVELTQLFEDDEQVSRFFMFMTQRIGQMKRYEGLNPEIRVRIE